MHRLKGQGKSEIEIVKMKGKIQDPWFFFHKSKSTFFKRFEIMRILNKL